MVMELQNFPFGCRLLCSKFSSGGDELGGKSLDKGAVRLSNAKCSLVHRDKKA